MCIAEKGDGRFLLRRVRQRHISQITYMRYVWYDRCASPFFGARAAAHIARPGPAGAASDPAPRAAARAWESPRAGAAFCLTTVRVLRESLAAKMDVIKREEAKRVAYTVLT